MKILFLFLAFQQTLILIKCEDKYFPSNLFEIIPLKLVSFDENPQANGLKTVTQTVNFSSFFSSTPNILLGINEFDFSITLGSSQFNVSVQQACSSSANILFTKNGEYTFYNFGIRVLAIQDDNIRIQSFTLSGSDGVNQNKNFQLPAKGSIQRQSYCFLTGLSYTSSNNKLQFGVNVKSFTENGYTINIVTQDISIINSINVNCIEYYQVQQGDYSMITEIQNLNFQNVNVNSSPYTQQQNVIRSSKIEGSTSINFYGISMMKNTYKNPQSIRMKISNSFSTNTNTIQAETRDDSDILSLDIGFFNYSIYNCLKNEKISFINYSQQQKCVQKCPDLLYQQGQYSICVPKCNNSQYLLNKVCYDNYPDNSYCDTNKVCKNCISQYCQQCEQNLQDCLQCVPNQFFFLKNCTPEKPKNSYCKIKK
ncbi:hypothetical protein ABPG73_004781 [Tetrahymena malaccensis]